MTDRTDEFRGAVKVFRPTVLAQNNAVTNENFLSSPGATITPHLSLQQQRHHFASFFDDDEDDAGTNGQGMAGDGRLRYAMPETSEFLQMAASVAVGFEGTAKLIERLKKLVGRKGFSNNPAAEISDVMKLFEGDMAGLQKDVAALQRYANGESKGSPRRNSQRQLHCQHIVDTLKHSFQEHTKAFRDALLLRAAVEKQQNDRQRKFSHSRGVAPATQLDYPLFDNSNAFKNNGVRSRASARRPSPPPRPLPPPPPPSIPPNAGVALGNEATSVTRAGIGLGARDGVRNSMSGGPVGTAADPLRGEAGGTVAKAGESAQPFHHSVDGNSSSSRVMSIGGMAGVDGKLMGGIPRTGGSEDSGVRYPGAVTSPFGANGASGAGYGGVGQGRGGGANTASRYGGGGGQQGTGSPLPPTEQFRPGSGAFGLRKRGGGGDGEEETRRAAWQVQVQEESKNRVEESHKVEKMIGELGQMFSRFSTMVAAQEEVVLHIEDDVEAAHAFAEEGQAHLAKYYQVISGNRGIIIKVFIMLIIFIWVFLGLMR